MKKILYLSAAIFLASCGNKSADKSAELTKLKKQQAELNIKIAELENEVGAKPDSNGKVTDVSVIAIAPTTFRSYIQIQGKIDAEENVIANAESPGVITAIYIKAGQRVTRGQVLAQIDDKAIQQGIANAQTQVELSRTLFERQKNLWDQKIGTEVQYLQAKAGKESAELQLAQIKAQANMYKIKSPIDGTVDQMDLKLGQAIQPGNSDIRIINDARLKAKATVAESYAGRVNQGDDVLVIFPDVQDSDTLKTKISFAAKAIDPISRSFQVEIKLPYKSAYRPNMLAVLKIVDYERKNAVVVPLNAIQRSESGEYVFIAENNIAKRINIKIGGTYNGTTEVISGLKAGEKLIITGIQDLNDGDRIKI